jgi:uncharacterized 2Fe-2S/4Fe-4S cluster protein (DUF4445 family)
MEKFKVTFYPDNKTVEVEKGKTILTAAISASVYINSSCGGEGVCGRCKVIVKIGQVFSQPTGRIIRKIKSSRFRIKIKGDLFRSRRSRNFRAKNQKRYFCSLAFSYKIIFRITRAKFR